MDNIDPKDMARYWRGLPHQENAISAAISSLPIDIRGELFSLVIRNMESKSLDKMIRLWRAEDYPPLVFLIASFEGFSARAYLCPSGTWTIGFGRTVGVSKGQTTLMSLELDWLGSHVRDLSYWVSSQFPMIKEEHQIAALTSLTFNIGKRAVYSSTLAKCLVRGDFQGATTQFSRWVYGSDKNLPLPGLVHRRQIESALFAFGWDLKKIRDQIEIGKRLIALNQ